MLTQIILEAWIALKRNVTRSLLTMLGIVWGIATVTLLIAYGNSFRSVLVNGFNAFGKSVVIGWPGQTSEQPGGQRAGKKVVLEQAGQVRLPRNRTAPGYRLSGSSSRDRCRSRRVPRVWRDAQRNPLRRPMDQ
jgi:MacB-like periplasmic core domain